MNWNPDAHKPCAVIPSPIYDHGLEDWSQRIEAGSDEQEIVRIIDGPEARDKRVLHIGIGNSFLARRLAKEARYIDGVTMNPREAEIARKVNILSYRVIVGDKHLPETYWKLRGTYDWIIETGLTTYSCCPYHLASYFGLLLSMLAAGGTIWTHEAQFGQRWHTQKHLEESPIPAMEVAAELAEMAVHWPIDCQLYGQVIAIRRKT